MPKRLEVTPKIQGYLDSAAGEPFDASKVAVFETISINSLPVSKNNIFQGAVHPRQTLLEMAEFVAKRPLTHHVPMHTNHEQGYEMPVGKVFHGDVVSRNGVEELRSLFYIDLSEDKLVAKVESDSIQEVSVGVRYKHLNCSQCGFDFLGADATNDHIWERTCANDHQIGTEGVHLVCNGLDRWMEQSLVSLGAANGAKIQSHTRALLGEDVYTQLAASGRDPAATTLYASATPPQEKSDMDLAQLVEKVGQFAVEKQNLETQLSTFKTEAESLRPLTAKVTELEAEVATLKTGDAAVQKARADAALSFIHKEAVRLTVAAGGTAESVAADADVAVLVAAIETNRSKLMDSIPVGGVANPQGAGGVSKKTPAHASAFKTVRN